MWNGNLDVQREMFRGLCVGIQVFGKLRGFLKLVDFTNKRECKQVVDVQCKTVER